jgi:hypothetical protein
LVTRVQQRPMVLSLVPEQHRFDGVELEMIKLATAAWTSIVVEDPTELLVSGIDSEYACPLHTSPPALVWGRAKQSSMSTNDFSCSMLAMITPPSSELSKASTTRESSSAAKPSCFSNSEAAITAMLSR